MSGEIRRNSCCWGMLHSIWNASRSMLVTCLRVLVGSFQSWFVSPQMHSYDIWYRLSYLCIYIYIYTHNINLCICTNMRNCLKHAQNMSHTHAFLTNIFMYVSCACMSYIYIYIYVYIHIYTYTYKYGYIYIYMIRY